jgi:hypothetical protein
MSGIGGIPDRRQLTSIGFYRCTPARQAEELITLGPMAASERCPK